MKNAFDFWDQLDDEQKRNLRAVEKKYGGNRWWESNDPATALKYQIEEKMQVIAVSDYVDMLGEFLERPVCHMEIAFDYERIKADVRLAIKRRGLGIGQSEEQRETAHNDYVRRVENIVETQLPKDRVMKVDLSQKPERNDKGIDVSGCDGWLNPE